MNKKKIIKYFCIISCIVLVLGAVFASIPNVSADVGNNNRYSSSSSSSSSSTSSSSDSDIFWFIWLMFDILGPIPTILILFGVIIGFIILKKKGVLNNISNDLNNHSVQNTVPHIYDNTENVAKQIREIDPNFSSDAFVGWVREVFLKIQQAWSDRKWEEIRPFESNELFSQHNSQLEEYIKNKKINKVEKIAIKQVSLQSFSVDGDKEVLTVYLDAVMRDYVIDEVTGKVLESDPNKDWYMKYVMIFNRKAGVKTEPGMSNKSVTNCPNCGAPTEITSSGKCEYCKSVITTGEHDWVLSDIRSR